MTQNSVNENGAKLSPQYSHDCLNCSNQCSSYSSTLELGLRGGEHLAQYYLELVKMHLPFQDVFFKTKITLDTEARRNRERLEIEDYSKKFVKRR